MTVSQFLSIFKEKMRETNKKTKEGEGEGAEEGEEERYTLVSVSKLIGFTSANVTNMANVSHVLCVVDSNFFLHYFFKLFAFCVM